LFKKKLSRHQCMWNAWIYCSWSIKGERLYSRCWLV